MPDERLYFIPNHFILLPVNSDIRGLTCGKYMFALAVRNTKTPSNLL